MQTLKHILIGLFLFICLSGAQDFSYFIEHSKPEMSDADLGLLKTLLSVDGVKYYESIVSVSSDSKLSIIKEQFWLEEGILLLSNSQGELGNYKSEKDVLEPPESTMRMLYMPTGIFEPLQTLEGVVDDTFNRAFSKTPKFPEGIFRNLNLATSAPLMHMLIRTRQIHASELSKEDYISAARTKEIIEKLEALLKLKPEDKVVELGDYKLSIKFSPDGLPLEIYLTSEKENFFMLAKNVFKKADYPKLNAKISDPLFQNIPEAYDKLDYGFHPVFKNGNFSLEYDIDGLSKKLYENSIMSIFFRCPILEINGAKPQSLESICKMMRDCGRLEVKIKTEAGAEKSFTFRKLGTKDRYIVRFSASLGIDAANYFKSKSQ